MTFSVEPNPVVVEELNKIERVARAAFVPFLLTAIHFVLSVLCISYDVEGLGTGFLLARIWTVSAFYAYVLFVVAVLCDVQGTVVSRKKRYPLVYLIQCDTVQKELLVWFFVASPFVIHAVGFAASSIDDPFAYWIYGILVAAYFVLPVPAFFFFDVTVKE
jgi:hypothetical protein